MCICDPNIRTPYCGKGTCVNETQKSTYAIEFSRIPIDWESSNNKLVCKGCGNSGKNIFSSDGFCTCPIGQAEKSKLADQLDRHFWELIKKGEE